MNKKVRNWPPKKSIFTSPFQQRIQKFQQFQNKNGEQNPI